MNYLYKLSRDIKCKKRRHKLNSINRFTALAVLGVSIGGVVVGLFAKNCLCEIKSIIIDNAKDSDVDGDKEENKGVSNEENKEVSKEENEKVSKEEDEEVKIKREEIKQTLDMAPDKSVGDVGVAMEKALEDLED